MISTFLQYYRCPDLGDSFKVSDSISEGPAYFKWGEDTICYARSAGGFGAHKIGNDLYDISSKVVLEDNQVVLPFDPDELLQNLQRERYSAHFREPGKLSHTIARHVYYALRPFLPVPIRKHFQRLKLRDWNQLSFPEWPVDCTVDRIHRRLMALAMRAAGVETMPFIWFWPEEHLGCVILTHDVETATGRDFCEQMMDIDESYGFHGSFQVIPEERYDVPPSYLSRIVERGHEVNVHDLNHDGRLYVEYGEFLRRVKKINEYARKFKAVGFRSGIMYRNADWFDNFTFDYDMSIPNVGHLDPQRGGCCTVMPYFIGNIVELPLTSIQDYSLFHVLRDYTTNISEQQTSRILANHGLISILVHPDYVIEAKAQASYKSLLGHLAELRDTNNLWCPLPKAAAEWWRQRSKLRLVSRGNSWEIEGEGSERARIAYARLSGDSVAYSLHGADARSLEGPVATT